MTKLHLKLVIPSDPRYLPVVRGAIAPLAAAIGWDESDCRAITLALDEALANIIRHAYHNCLEGSIELECRESADGLESLCSITVRLRTGQKYVRVQ